MADILQEIAEAIEDYSRIFPPPYSLAPNLQLASEAAAEIYGLRQQLREALAQVGLPEGTEPLTDGEWREFQQIPEQGYSHRSWVDAKIAQRLRGTAGTA